MNLYESMRKSLNEADGWIAFFGDKRVEITKDEAKDLWGAKQVAIRKLNVPKSKTSLVAVEPAYNEDNLDNAPASNAQFESCSKKARVPKKLKEASGKKTFIVTIEETVDQDFEVEAVDMEEAEEIAIEKYNNGEFVLEPGNLTDKMISVRDPETDESTSFNSF